jgi:hypothetical protein
MTNPSFEGLDELRTTLADLETSMQAGFTREPRGDRGVTTAAIGRSAFLADESLTAPG